MPPAKEAALYRWGQLAETKERRRDELLAVFRAALRAGHRPSRAAIDALAVEADAAAFHRARADGLSRSKAMQLSSHARKHVRNLLAA